MKNIADTLEKKLQHGAARRDKRKNLKDFEIKPDYVEPDSFARGGQAYRECPRGGVSRVGW